MVRFYQSCFLSLGILLLPIYALTIQAPYGRDCGELLDIDDGTTRTSCRDFRWSKDSTIPEREYIPISFRQCWKARNVPPQSLNGFERRYPEKSILVAAFSMDCALRVFGVSAWLCLPMTTLLITGHKDVSSSAQQLSNVGALRAQSPHDQVSIKLSRHNRIFVDFHLFWPCPLRCQWSNSAM